MNKLFSHTNEVIDYKREVMGGLINFMAIAYIIIVNPLILNANGQGFPIAATMSATILVMIILTILAGLIVKLPFAMAPGMGINAIISYALVVNDKLPIPIVLGVIFWSGILFLIFSLTGLQHKILAAIPKCIQQALTVGIGVFLIFIGLKQANITVAHAGTILAMGKVTFEFCRVFF